MIKEEVQLLTTKKDSLEKETLTIKVELEKLRQDLLRHQSGERHYQSLKDSLHRQELEIRTIHEQVALERNRLDRNLLKLDQEKEEQGKRKQEVKYKISPITEIHFKDDLCDVY